MPIELGKKVSELSGAELDFWAGKANGENVQIIGTRVNGKCYRMHGLYLTDEYSPSTDWSQGGPIIQREKIESHFNPYANKWIARYFEGNKFVGETLLIAAMRSKVAKEFGEEVPNET